MPRYPTRTASFIITFLGVITNLSIALQVLAAWRSIKWEPESEWESASDKWTLNGIKVAWGLLLTYFSAATVVCAVGFAGVVKSKPSFVKFYRDYSIADFAVCASLTLFAAYGSTLPSTPLGVCEGLSRQPELMRDLAEMGLSSENCERWFKRTAIAGLGVMFLALVARLHFILAIGIYYSHLFRHFPGRIPMLHSPTSPTHTHAHSHSHSHSRSFMRRRSMDNLQRVYLLPRSITDLQASPVSPVSATPLDHSETEEIVMYAPVPLSKLPKEVAHNLKRAATEGWVRMSSSSSTRSQHRHQHRHHSSHSHSYAHHPNVSLDVMNGSGQIHLPMLPDEGLLSSQTPTDVEKA